MKYRWFAIVSFLTIGFECFAIQLESQVLPFDIRAASVRFAKVLGHRGLDLTNSAIVNDDNGYLWIGTQDGLVRLDGYTSRRFVASSKSENTLVGNYVYTLAFEKATSRLWIGTSNGLSVYDLKSETFTNYRHNRNPKSLSDSIVQTIFIDIEGRVWLGTKNGLNLYNSDSDNFTRFHSTSENVNGLSHDNVLDIKQDSKNNIWIATQVGLNVFRTEGEFERFSPFQNDDGSDGLVTRIAIDQDDQLWLGTEQKGLIHFNPETKQSNQFLKQNNISELPSNYIRSLLFSNDGNLWIGTSSGVSLYNTQSKNFLNFENEQINGNVVSLYQDPQDVIWIGTWSKGLYRFNPRETQIGTLGLRFLKSQENILKSITKGLNGDIWFANPKNLYLMQSSKERIVKYELAKINPTSIRAIPFVNRNEKAVFLLTDKIYRITDPENLIAYELPAAIRNASWYSASFDDKGRLWLGSRNLGIYILSPDFKRIERHIQSAIAGYIRQIDEQTMLVGSFTATYWININSFDTSTHRPEETPGMLHPNVTGYHQLADGTKWLATSGGIHQLNLDADGKEYYKTWTKEDGLPTDVLTGPLEDSQGKLWFSSTDGLIRLNTKNEVVQHFGESLGALSNYYIGQYVKGDDKRLYFQGPNGLSIIDEQYVKDNHTQYDVLVDEFRLQDEVQHPVVDEKSVLNKTIQYTGAIILPPQERDFTFNFTTTYLAQPEKAKFFYRLEGFDDKWLETDYKNRQLKYTNLNPNQYQFQIYSVSPTGIKSNVVKIDLSIMPFYYETIWFRFLVATFVVTLFFAWYRYRIFKIKQYNQQLEIEVEQRTQDIRTLANIGKDISSLLDIHELLEHLYIHLNKSLEVSVLAVGIYEADKDRIKFERSLESGETMPTHYRPMNAKTELAAWCIENNQELVLNEHSERFKYLEANSGPIVGESMQTVVYLPISSHSDNMLGCLTVQSKDKNAYDKDDLDFIRTISNYTGIALDNALAHSELKRVSTTDYLTNLPNRLAFIEQAQFQVEVFKRSSMPLTFAMADIDYFKQFNDKYGHDCGDFVLKKVAEIFRQSIREQDMVARWGGEEFIFMFPNTGADGCKTVLNKLKGLLESSIFEFKGVELNITATFGGTSFAGTDDIESVINKADVALFQGKANGRNCVQMVEEVKGVKG